MPDDFLWIAAPHGSTKEVVQSTRYRWENSQRGSDPFVIIQHTESGCGRFVWEGESWEVPAGHAFIALVPEASSYSSLEGASNPWEFGWINLYGDLAMSLCRALRAAYGPVLPLPLKSTPASLFQSLVAQAERRVVQDPSDVSTACFAFLMEWKRVLDRPAGRDPVETAKRICHTRYREPIGIKELALQTGLSREHLTRLFTEKVGSSPARYLRELRLEAVREFVATSSGTMKEAALRCGFPSAKALRRALNSRP
ncbi:MAG TPA: helix-turn-helix domain-containing protein [Chthoniobacterales bacterium]|jgi:AraC-like DNA-binding protein